jgi:hypothetical protein
MCQADRMKKAFVREEVGIPEKKSERAGGESAQCKKAVGKRATANKRLLRDQYQVVIMMAIKVETVCPITLPGAITVVTGAYTSREIVTKPSPNLEGGCTQDTSQTYLTSRELAYLIFEGCAYLARAEKDYVHTRVLRLGVVE